MVSTVLLCPSYLESAGAPSRVEVAAEVRGIHGKPAELVDGERFHPPMVEDKRRVDRGNDALLGTEGGGHGRLNRDGGAEKASQDSSALLLLKVASRASQGRAYRPKTEENMGERGHPC